MRDDFVIVQGARASTLIFAQLFALFSVKVKREWYQLAIVQTLRRRPRNKVSGYIELEVAKSGEFEIIYLDSIIRSGHFMPPSPHQPRWTVQDLADGDTYLRLIHLK
jgi:hypothetical protein